MREPSGGGKVAEWLAAYGRAWEAKDTAAFVRLFSPDAHYHWTPFDEPKRGHDGIAAAFDAAVARQRDIRFTAGTVLEQGSIAMARWRCSFERPDTGARVRIDGASSMEFAADGRCRVFREWWHSDE